MADPKVTPADIRRFSDDLARGDRAAFYLDYYDVTGAQQILTLAQISSFSGAPGAAADLANAVDAKIAPHYPAQGVEWFSLQIANDVLSGVKTNLAKGGDGVLPAKQIVDIAQGRWRQLGLEKYFPGKAMEAEALVMHDGAYAGAHKSDILTPGFWVGATSAALAVSEQADLQNNREYLQSVADFSHDMFGIKPRPPDPPPPGVTQKTSRDGKISWQVGPNGKVTYGSVKTPDDLAPPPIPGEQAPAIPLPATPHPGDNPAVIAVSLNPDGSAGVIDTHGMRPPTAQQRLANTVDPDGLANPVKFMGGEEGLGRYTGRVPYSKLRTPSVDTGADAGFNKGDVSSIVYRSGPAFKP